jgi:hypothetical protein
LAGVDATVQQRHFLQVRLLAGGLGNDGFRKGTTIDAGHHDAPATVDLLNPSDGRHGQAQRLGLRQSRGFAKHGTLGHACLVELDDSVAQLEDLGLFA